MSADQLLYQMDHSSQNEWYDFENFFEFPSGFLDSNSTSTKDYDLSFTDVDGLGWGSGSDPYAQLSHPDVVNYEDPFGEYIDQAWGMSETNADPNDFLQFPQSPKEELATPVFNSHSSFDASNDASSFYSTLRHMVESQAATERHGSSQKERRRDAAIAIHLQRLQGHAMPDLELFPEAGGFPSPPELTSAHCAPFESPASVSLSESTSKSATPPSIDTTPGGMELVLDLNMNTPANLPKKQKPRSRAQKENYIKVRKHGACEKHRKQHKRCNCLESSASRLNVNPATLVPSNKMVGSFTNANLQVHATTHRQSTWPTTPKQANVAPNLQPTRPVDLHHLDRVVHLDQRHVHSGTSRGQSVDQVPSPSSTQTPTQPRRLPLVTSPSAPGQVRTKIRRITHPSVPGTHTHTVVPRTVEQHLKPASEGSSVRTQPTKSDSGAMHLHAVPGKSVVPSQGQLVTSLGSAIRKAVGTVSTFLQVSASATSSAGTLFGRFVVFSSRQYMLARKGMGLF
ncbi:hypothetical protein BDV59DRAFT_155827 [Aspergillus ambiguus]|uniref:uncharacterized protein n=1 Tax=Aspergillus ambiguus TaxID=176160 RepID=UPI003CCDE5E8